jgi:hypothetical protein
LNPTFICFHQFCFIIITILFFVQNKHKPTKIKIKSQRAAKGIITQATNQVQKEKSSFFHKPNFKLIIQSHSQINSKLTQNLILPYKYKANTQKKKKKKEKKNIHTERKNKELEQKFFTNPKS